MLFRQVLYEDLGCASFVISDGNHAAVVDPAWEIEPYLELAAEHGFRIAHVLETHTHADHVSGRGRLVEATGAAIHVSADADVEYPHEPLEEIELGPVCIRALPTPGHRPEHVALLIEDRSRVEEPWLVLAGDCLFVGDVGRPDLAIEPEEGARELFRSLRTLLELPDHVEVWPAHIGGSLCGGSDMSKKPSSTIGFERRFSELLQLEDEAAFVREVTLRLRPQPPNFERIVELNRGPLLTQAVVLEPVTAVQVERLLQQGAILVDGRAPREFDALHVPGSVSVTMTESGVGTRAAWVLDPERDLVVVAADDEDARRLGRMLEAVGLRKLQGFLAGAVPAWQDADMPVETLPAVDVPGVAEQLREGEVVLLDVREDDEWEQGHVEGSVHVPFHEFRDGVPDEVQSARDGMPVAVACSAGARSAVAASLLRRFGLDHVEHVVNGGVPDLAEHGIDLVET